MFHAIVKQWELEDGAALDPRDVVTRWASGDCGSLLHRVREALAGADLVLTFDGEHGTSLHPDHRATALLVATAIDGMSRRPRLYAVMNRAEVLRGGTLITFAPAPAVRDDCLVSDASSWPAVLAVARSHRSQFDDAAITRLRDTSPEARVIVAAPVTGRPAAWCAAP
jgi:LmbE family N-acetylglucosaminyl deacetylase